MQTEAVSNKKSNGSASTDPVLLGVSLPVSATVSAATQVRDAWMQAITEIVAAARAKANEKKADLTKKTSEVAKAADPNEIVA